MAKLVILLACIAAFHAVSALESLECYTCDNEICKKDMKQWQKTKCGGIADPTLETACQKFAFKDKDGKENVLRKCAVIRKTGETPCPPLPQGATDAKCPVCKTDLCNSASSVNFSFAAVASVLIAFLGQKYLL